MDRNVLTEKQLSTAIYSAAVREVDGLLTSTFHRHRHQDKRLILQVNLQSLNDIQKSVQPFSQVQFTGPGGIDYVNPADDPRKK